MYVFAKPRYLRTWQDPVTRLTAPAYQFDVTGADQTDHLSFLLDSGESLTVQAVEDALRDDAPWWHAFLQQFLTASGSYFSRPYTVAHLERILQHKEVVSASTEDPALPRHVRCIPRMLHFSSGTLHVYWTAEETSAGIALPEEAHEDIPPIIDLAENSSSLSSAGEGDLKEWDAETLPEETTGAPSSLLSDPAMLLDRQRVKEARLRAKLAVYRAQYQLHRYYEKYGDELSESEEDSEDSEEDEEEEDGPLL